MKYIPLIVLLLILSSCGQESTKKILYINSYNQGYPSSDQVMEGIKNTFKDHEVDLTTFFLDSKRQSDSSLVKKKCEEIFNSIKDDKPDLIILSDDNSVKYFGEAYVQQLNRPIVFCGVNWDHSGYNLPKEKVTGMLEILPVRECIEMIRRDFPSVKKLGILSENTTSEIKNQAILDTLTRLENYYRIVNQFNEWKDNFLDLNQKVDLIFLPTNGAITNWNKTEAIELIHENARVPVFTCDDFMMEYSMIGMTKIAAEQGEWAARTAIEILNGKKVKDIPVTANSRFEYWFNPELAKAINYKMPAAFEFNIYQNQKSD